MAQPVKNILEVVEGQERSAFALGTFLLCCLVMLADMKDWADFNKTYLTYFEPPYPARSAFGTSGLALGARAEVECIAVR